MAFPPIAHSYTKLKTSVHTYRNQQYTLMQLNETAVCVIAWHCLVLKNLFFTDTYLCEIEPPGSAVHHEPLLPQLPEVLLDLLLETRGFGAQNFSCCHSKTQNVREQTIWPMAAKLHDIYDLLCKAVILTKDELSYFPLWSNLYILVHEHQDSN